MVCYYCWGFKGTAILTVGVWHTSSDNQQRLYFDNNGTTFIQGQGTIPIVFVIMLTLILLQLLHQE
jgi:hypothetical protein